MPRYLLRWMLAALGLPLAGTVGAAVHGGGLLATLPGQDTETVGFAGIEHERGYAALFEGDDSPLLRLPFRAFHDETSGLLYGPMLRYSAPGDPARDAFPGGSGRDVIEGGGFLAWRSGPWRVQGSALGGNPFAGDTGLVGLTGSYALHGGDRLTLVFSGSASYASDDYLEQRMLDDPHLAVTIPGRGGLGDLGLRFNASYRFGSAWSLVGMFGIHHTLAEDGALPGVDDGPRIRAGAAFRYAF
ncbi:MAG: hypothetical protein R3298_05240 [Gammaproteobacteria bacterium]|nr:hypothetical protein [Gammaproteobacteria bacterium]